MVLECVLSCVVFLILKTNKNGDFFRFSSHIKLHVLYLRWYVWYREYCIPSRATATMRPASNKQQIVINVIEVDRCSRHDLLSLAKEFLFATSLFAFVLRGNCACIGDVGPVSSTTIAIWFAGNTCCENKHLSMSSSTENLLKKNYSQ